MKKIIIIVSIIVLLAIGLFPKVEVYEDGGTKTYSAFLYKYIKWGKMVDCDNCVKPYYKESELIFFPNNFKNLDSYWKEENLKKIPKYKPLSNKNTEKNINISKKENSETQKIVEDFTLKLGKEKNNVKQGIFNWNTEDGVSEIKGFIIKDEKSKKDNYEIAEELFKDWKQNMMSAADGPGTSIVGYQKENVVCNIKSEMNATMEQINTMENPASLGYTLTISCGKYQEKSFEEKGKIVKGLQLEADSENPTWSIMINDNMLIYDSPENEPKKGKDFDVITRQDGNTIYFEGKMDNETISGTFKKQKCISKGKDLNYFVSVDYNNKKLTACGESFGDEDENTTQNDIQKFINTEVKHFFKNTNFSDYTETTLALKPAKIENPQKITAYKITVKDIDFKESEEIKKLFLDNAWGEFPEYNYGLGKYSWNIGVRKDEFTCSIELKSKDGKKGDLEIICGK